MAVLDEVPGIEVTIQIDGQNVTEYYDPHASNSDSEDDSGCPVVSKYIEAIDDAEFSIRMAIDDDVYAWDCHYLFATTNVDGYSMAYNTMRIGRECMAIEGKDSYSGETGEPYCIKPKFSAISKVLCDKQS